MTVGANIEKINSERNKRNKSTYVWYSDRDNRVKLEIGSNVKPDPYSKKILKFLKNHHRKVILSFQRVNKT